MYAELNACMRKRLGACMRNLGAKYAETFGCMYMPFGCISDTADSLPDSRLLA